MAVFSITVAPVGNLGSMLASNAFAEELVESGSHLPQVKAPGSMSEIFNWETTLQWRVTEEILNNVYGLHHNTTLPAQPSAEILVPPPNCLTA